ncbi:hypothetical protein SNE40_017009 [Patella caerulea]|uniref:Uncharacterized protein n=1 Tax=Patella caerulea TaxID=87958 RepID=A0AAN8JAA8_PATCE
MAKDRYLIDETAMGAFYVLFAIFGTIFNCAVIATVLSSSNLRSKGMFIIIVCISFAGLLQSIFVNSVFAHINLVPPSTQDWCPTLGALVTTDVCLAVTMYCLILLFVNHLIHQRSPNESRERNMGIIGSISLSVLFVILVPVMKTQPWSWPGCYWLLFMSNYNIRIGLTVVEFLLPAFLLCVGRIIPIFIFGQRSSVVPTPIVVAALMTVVTNMPGRILEILHVNCSYSESCDWSLWLPRVLQMIYLGNVVVIPLSWLLDNEFRQSLLTILGLRPTPELLL